MPVSYLGNLTLSLLRVKTPAEDINNDMEKGEMVIGDRKLTVDDENIFLRFVVFGAKCEVSDLICFLGFRYVIFCQY